MRRPRSSYRTALLLALLHKRSGNSRIRISLKTIRSLSRRKQLRGVFLDSVTSHLDEMGYVFIELVDTVGYGMMQISSLSGAKPATAKRYLAQDLMRLNSKDDDYGFDDIEMELFGDDEEVDDAEE